MHRHGVNLRDRATVPAIVVTDPGKRPARAVCGTPFFFMLGGVLTTATALRSPLTILIMPRMDPAEALKLIERKRGTSLIRWLTVKQTLRAHPDFAKRDLSSAPAVLPRTLLGAHQARLSELVPREIDVVVETDPGRCTTWWLGCRTPAGRRGQRCCGSIA